MTKKSTIIKSKILCAYQIIGGLIGLVLTIKLCTVVAINILFIFIMFIALGLYSYSIFCGILILNSSLKGLKHSRINQFLQIFNFSILGYSFQYISGIFISIGIDLTHSFNLQANFGISTWEIAFNQDSELSVINFNIVALFILILLDRRIKRLQEKDLADQLTGIGQDIESYPHSS